MPDFCSDCGKPAVGRFDLTYRRPEREDPERTVVIATDHRASRLSQKQRPLCASCRDNRAPLIEKAPAEPAPEE